MKQLTDVTAKQYHARYMAILNKYDGKVTAIVKGVRVTNAEQEQARDKELAELRKEFDGD